MTYDRFIDIYTEKIYESVTLSDMIFLEVHLDIHIRVATEI